MLLDRSLVAAAVLTTLALVRDPGCERSLLTVPEGLSFSIRFAGFDLAWLGAP